MANKLFRTIDILTEMPRNGPEMPGNKNKMM